MVDVEWRCWSHFFTSFSVSKTLYQVSLLSPPWPITSTLLKVCQGASFWQRTIFFWQGASFWQGSVWMQQIQEPILPCWQQQQAHCSFLPASSQPQAALAKLLTPSCLLSLSFFPVFPVSHLTGFAELFLSLVWKWKPSTRWVNGWVPKKWHFLVFHLAAILKIYLCRKKHLVDEKHRSLSSCMTGWRCHLHLKLFLEKQETSPV